MPGPDGRPDFDPDEAQLMVGKYIIIGLTYLTADGEFIETKQFHGRIRSADAMDGFAVDLRGSRDGETYWIPPDPSAITPAPPGEYRMRSTGEVVVDPDLMTSWTMRKSPDAPADSTAAGLIPPDGEE